MGIARTRKEFTDMLRITLLGGFHLRFDAQTVTTVESPRLQSLIAYLIIHAGIPQARQQIAFHFWPVSEESQARTNLRKLFLQLRRALPDADTFLTFDNQIIQWRNDSPFSCDLLEVQTLLGQLRENPLNQEALTALFERYTDELLPSCYEDWIIPLREQLHQDVMAALNRLVMLLENQRAYREGIRYAQRLLAFDPLEETAYQRLMRLRAFDGDRAGALQVYRECAEILERELGVDPSPETNALYEQLRQAKSMLAPSEAPSSTKPTLLPLIGRQAEWQRLRQVWQEVVRGQARVVTITGEAGIGKTRLAEELLIWAKQQGIAAVRTRSYQAQGALAYAPIAELLRTETLYPSIQSLNENQLTHVARLLPNLLAEYPAVPPPQPMSESWQRQQFFAAIAHAVLATGQPLVLLFDDLQWADGETLTWLHFLVRAAATSPLLLVGTIRTGEVDDDQQLLPLLTALRRDDLLTELQLAPLSAHEVKELAHSLQDNESSTNGLTQHDSDQLYTDTEGNPLFVVEALRAQQDTGQAVDEGANESGLPPKIYALIRNRLAQLTPETQTLVNLAAVIGRSFSYDVLMQASAMGEEEVVDSLDELLDRQIIREQSVDGYDFTHDRIRDVAYGEISRTRRRLLHRRVAEALALVNQPQVEAISGLLAEHYAQAGQHQKAVDYLYIASQQATAQFSHQEALTLLHRALTLTAEQEYATRYRLLVACLFLHHFRRDADTWLQDLQSFERLVDAGQEKHDEFPQEGQAQLALFRQQYHHARSEWNAALHFGEQAIRLANQCGASLIEASAHHGSGRAYWALSKFDQAKAMLECALDKARVAHLDSIAAESLEHLMASHMFSGGEANRIATALDECMALYQKAGDEKGIAGIYNKYGYLPIAQGVGEYQQAQLAYERALAIYQRIGFAVGEANVWRNLIVLHTCVGDYRAAERCVSPALDVEKKLDKVEMIAVVQNYHGFALFNQGRLAEARQIQMHALKTFRKTTHSHLGVKAITALGWIHFYQHEFDAAHQYLTEALAQSRTINEVRQEGYTLTCLGHLLTTQARFDEARTAYQQALDAHIRMEQVNRTMEPKAGLAYVDHLAREPSAALAQVDEILMHLETHTLDRTEEGFYVYLLCYRILAAHKDERATALLQRTYHHLQGRAATIDDPAHRRLFWEAMPGHREIQLAWQAAVARGQGQEVISS